MAQKNGVIQNMATLVGTCVVAKQCLLRNALLRHAPGATYLPLLLYASVAMLGQLASYWILYGYYRSNIKILSNVYAICLKHVC